MALSLAGGARSVRFPLAPILGESFKGYTTRVAVHNGHASRNSLLYTLGVPREQVDRLELDAESVAHLYRQPVSAIADMLPRHRGDGKLVLAGEVLSPGALRVDRRWVAPIVLQEQGVDLAQWSNKSRKFCMQSWTWLSGRCPNEACGAKLKWGATSLFSCLKCGGDLRRKVPRSVEPGLRPLLSLTYDLGSERWERAAHDHLPPAIQGISPEVFMDLIQVLGATLRFHTVPWANHGEGGPSHLERLSYSEKLLRGCLALADPARVREAARGPGDKRAVTELRARLRALSLNNKPLQDAIKAVTGIRCLSQEEQEQSITVAAAKLKVPRAKLRCMILDGGIKTNVPSMGGCIRLYDEVMLDGLDDIINDRISISHLSAKFQLDRRIITDLEQAGELISLGGVARSLYREKQFKRSPSLAFFNNVEALVIRHGPDDDRKLLSEVMARLPAGPKPWASILSEVHLGRLAGELGSLDRTGLKLERLTLDNALADRLIAGDLELPRPYWEPDWRYATLRQAEDALGLYPRDIKLLQRAGFLEDASPGTSWEAIRHFARNYIGTRELGALVSVAPSDLGVEAAKRGLERVAPRVGAWDRRSAMDAFGVALPPY